MERGIFSAALKDRRARRITANCYDPKLINLLKVLPFWRICAIVIPIGRLSWKKMVIKEIFQNKETPTNILLPR
jgi:hypothetical protein